MRGVWDRGSWQPLGMAGCTGRHSKVPALYPECAGQEDREGITFILREDHSGTCVENEWPAQKQKPL